MAVSAAAFSFWFVMRRVVLGIFAIVFVVGGATLYFFGPRQESYAVFAASGLRIGLVLGAFWLAWPQLVRIPWWFVQIGLVGTLAVAVRPKAAVLVLPILAALWIIRPRKKTGAARKPAPQRGQSR
jgi:hypothetical protein